VRTVALWLLLGWAAFGQDFSHVSIEKVDAGFRFTEGPVWSREGFLLFSDVPNNQIRKLVPGERSTVFRDDSHGANGNTLDAQGASTVARAGRGAWCGSIKRARWKCWPKSGKASG